jgi:hypothetical protein
MKSTKVGWAMSRLTFYFFWLFLAHINSGFWIGDFGLLVPEFARLPAVESVALFSRIDISFWHPG